MEQVRNRPHPLHKAQDYVPSRKQVAACMRVRMCVYHTQSLQSPAHSVLIKNCLKV